MSMSTGGKREISRRRLLGAAAMVAAAALTVGRKAVAHPFDFLVGPALFVLAARRTADGHEIGLDISLYNGFGVAATLRSLWASVGDEVVIERRRRFFGYAFWQRVSLIRLEHGQTATLQAPEHRIRIRNVKAPADAPVVFELIADFGPLGKLYANKLVASVSPARTIK